MHYSTHDTICERWRYKTNKVRISNIALVKHCNLITHSSVQLNRHRSYAMATILFTSHAESWTRLHIHVNSSKKELIYFGKRLPVIVPHLFPGRWVHLSVYLLLISIGKFISPVFIYVQFNYTDKWMNIKQWHSSFSDVLWRRDENTGQSLIKLHHMVWIVWMAGMILYMRTTN